MRKTLGAHLELHWLASPEAAAIYPSVRHARWLEPFFDVTDENLRRLGARLLVQEMADRLGLKDFPDYEEELARITARERALRRAAREEAKRGRPRVVGGVNDVRRAREAARPRCPTCDQPVTENRDGTFRKHVGLGDAGLCASSGARVRP